GQALDPVVAEPRPREVVGHRRDVVREAPAAEAPAGPPLAVDRNRPLDRRAPERVVTVGRAERRQIIGPAPEPTEVVHATRAEAPEIIETAGPGDDRVVAEAPGPRADPRAVVEVARSERPDPDQHRGENPARLLGSVVHRTSQIGRAHV